MATIVWKKAINDVKEKKILELNSACNSTILGRFTQEVNGQVYAFSNDAEAQANFEKADRAFEKGRLTEIIWTAYDTDGNVARIILTSENFESVYMAHLIHIQSNISKYRDVLMPQVEQATTVNEVNSIVW